MPLEDLRETIRGIDEQILWLLAERMEVVTDILEEKKRIGMPINDDRQNELVLKRAMERATELGLDPAPVRTIFETIIKMSIEWQHELSDDESKAS